MHVSRFGIRIALAVAAMPVLVAACASAVATDRETSYYAIEVQDSVDIPGRMVLLLDEPGEDGRWGAKISGNVYCTFTRDPEGRVHELQIHERIRMRRTADPEPEEIDASVPEELRPLLGDYLLGPVQATFRVRFEGGRLIVDDPLAKRTIRMKAPDEAGRFVDEFDKNSMTFERDDEGAVIALVLDAANRFVR